MKKLFVAAFVISGLIAAAPIAASAARPPSSTPTTIPSSTGSSGGGTGVHPDSQVTEYCPDMSVGAYCGFTGFVGQGGYAETFTYIFDETFFTLRGAYSCGETTCSIQNCGEGAQSVPYSWTISGNYATFTSITPYCP
jgi:hypothetical protein